MKGGGGGGGQGQKGGVTQRRRGEDTHGAGGVGGREGAGEEEGVGYKDWINCTINPGCGSARRWKQWKELD